MAIKFQPQQEQQQEQPQEEKTYKIGDTFLHENKEPYMIVVSGGNEVILSCLTDGRRWKVGVKVSDIYKITQAEFDLLTGGRSSDFTQQDFKLTMI